jgi:hypothetical protein
MRVARRAGSQLASAVTAPSTRAAAAYVAGALGGGARAVRHAHPQLGGASRYRGAVHAVLPDGG